jgi:peroxidase
MYPYKYFKRQILILAYIEQIFQLGGPSWTVPLGRRDSTTASLSSANSDIPGGGSDLSVLVNTFSNKGFTVREMVALSGLMHNIYQT